MCLCRFRLADYMFSGIIHPTISLWINITHFLRKLINRTLVGNLPKKECQNYQASREGFPFSRDVHFCRIPRAGFWGFVGCKKDWNAKNAQPRPECPAPCWPPHQTPQPGLLLVACEKKQDHKQFIQSLQNRARSLCSFFALVVFEIQAFSRNCGPIHSC